MNEIKFRPAEKADCLTIASLYSISSDGVADYVWTKLAEPEEDPVLAPYSKLEENNSYYICGIALFPECRNQGVGTKLMELAETHAHAKGFKKFSLIVFEQNAGAKRLYDRLGYQEFAREAIVSHPLIHYTGDAILMVKTLEGD